MKRHHLTFLFIGIWFGIVMSKSEAISWFRIQEMFRFQSFHMYGIIGTALMLGMGLIYAIKKFKLKNVYGTPIHIADKKMSVPRYLFGGTLFGLGWAMTGACPGPIFVLIGQGFSIIIVVMLFAILGTLVYGLLRDYLPH